MALPKEPRQKMINFMYLVLTAMLALNVSSEILNAFKVVDTSLINSNTVVDKSNSGIQSSFEELAKDPANQAKAAIWAPKADSALAITAAASKFIEDLKTELKTAAGYKPELGEASMKDDDLDAASRLFDTQKKGEDLKNSLVKFRADILAVLPENKRKEVEASIPIDVSTKDNKSFAIQYFHMTPAVAALTMLSKFQSDVKRSGNLVASKCLEQVGKVVIPLDKFEAFTGTNSTYLMPGEPFELTAGLGAFSSKNTPTVSVNGSNVPVDANGVALYKENASGGGTRNLSVVVSFTDPNTGEKKSVTKQVSYTVGQPSGAAIFLSKMNVVYIGVDNPIQVSGGSGGGAEKMSVSFSGGGLSGSGSSYSIKPSASAVGKQTLTVNVGGKPTPFEIRVKFLPDPVAMVGSYTDGLVSAAALKAQGGVIAKLKDSDFDAPFRITSYTVAGMVNGTPAEVPVTGAAWGNNPVMQNAKPGSIIGFYNIRAVGPDGSPRKLPALSFKLQ